MLSQAVAASTADVAGGLQLSRQRYLEQQCLLQQLQDLTHEVQALLLNHADQPDGAQQALADASHHAPPAAYASLRQHLAAAQAMQRLRLPGAGAPTRAAGDDDAAPEQDGSRHHLMGLTPEALKARHLPSKKAAQAAHAPLLPELEQRLAQQAQQLLEHLVGDDTPDAHAHVLQTVRDKLASVAAQEAEARALLRSCTGQAAQQVQLLQEMFGLLGQLVEDGMLKRQHGVDQVHAARLVQHIKTLYGKLKVLEVRLQEAAYTRETVPALRRVADLLQEEEDAARRALDQVGTQLLAYEECGEDFAQVVYEYGQVKEELRKVDHAVQRFTELQQELEHGGPGS